MIPPMVRKGANRSEKALFTALEGIVGHDDWIAMHSVVLAQNTKNLMGESDFVVLIPGKGIVVIEAKAPESVIYKNGAWKLVGTPSPDKDPLEQLEAAKRSIRSYILRNDLYDSTPMPRLLWFTNLGRHDFDGQSPQDMQFFEWELAWHNDLAQPAKAINKVIDEYTKWFSKSDKADWHSAGFTATEALAIADSMLRDFEVTRTAADRYIERNEVRRNILDEQVAQLELVDSNDRIYFDGAAGTGKSFLLQEAAVKLAKSGNKTLVLCWNVMMAEETEHQIGGRPNLVVRDFNKLMLEVIGKQNNPADAKDDWYKVKLPKKAIEVLKQYPEIGGYDAICIDEVQDVASSQLLIEFALRMTKDKFDSKMVLAGDRFQQIMTDGMAQVDPYAELKKMLPDLVRVTLKTNCRNAPALSEQLPGLTGLTLNVTRHRIPQGTDGGIQVYKYNSNNQTKELAKVIRQLLKEFRPEDIRILSPFGPNHSVVGELLQREAQGADERYLKTVLRWQQKDGIRWRSIAKFKGLESDVVILTDVDQRAKDFYVNSHRKLGEGLYVGASRARYWCLILTSDDVLTYQPRKVRPVAN
jgi:hypothetical protein